MTDVTSAGSVQAQTPEYKPNATVVDNPTEPTVETTAAEPVAVADDGTVTETETERHGLPSGDVVYFENGKTYRVDGHHDSVYEVDGDHTDIILALSTLFPDRF